MKKPRLKRGMIARYTGTDHAFMTGLKVKLIAPILDDNEKPTGWWDVAPWIEQDQRFSWVTSDARREDLVPLVGGEIMKAMPDTTIDMSAVRREIAAAHRSLSQWEKATTEPTTPHERWTKLAEFAGPNLKRAMSAGTVHIEIPNDGRGKPRFALKED